MLDKGLDPNFVFIENEGGWSCVMKNLKYTEKNLIIKLKKKLHSIIAECAMTIAAGLKMPKEMLITLVAKGAHIDLRNHKSLTALHKAAVLENYEALKVPVSCLKLLYLKDKVQR